MGFRINRQCGTGNRLSEDLQRVRRHLAETAEQLQEVSRRIPLGETPGDVAGAESRRHGSSTSSNVIGLELALNDVADRARQLLRSLEDLAARSATPT